MLYGNGLVPYAPIVRHPQIAFPSWCHTSPSTIYTRTGIALHPLLGLPQGRLEQRFKIFPRGTWSLPESEHLGRDLLSSLNLGTLSICFLDVKAVLYFFSSISVSVFRTMKALIGAMKELENSSLFDKYLAVLPVSKVFALCTSNVTPINSLCGRSSITSSMMLFKTDRCHFAHCGTTSAECGSCETSTIVENSFVTISFIVDLTSRAITFSLFPRRFSM